MVLQRRLFHWSALPRDHFAVVVFITVHPARDSIPFLPQSSAKHYQNVRVTIPFLVSAGQCLHVMMMA